MRRRTKTHGVGNVTPTMTMQGTTIRQKPSHFHVVLVHRQGLGMGQSDGTKNRDCTHLLRNGTVPSPYLAVEIRF